MVAKALTAALKLCARGFAVHWVRPRSKAPIESGWSNAKVDTAEELKVSFRPGNNVGFRAGTWSTVDGDAVCVLDVDVRGGAKYQKEALAAAEAVYGGPIDYDVVSGSGHGRHKYLRFPPGQVPNKAALALMTSDVYVLPSGAICKKSDKGAKPAWMVELLSTGKNVVAPPSIHPDTAKPYVALRDLSKIDHAPAALLEFIDKLNAPPDWEVPEPLGRDLPPVLPITDDMLPAPIRAWCVDIAHRMQCPLEFTAVAAIAMFGSIIGAGCTVRPKQKDNWTEVPNLWGAIVARPGRLKTPALNQTFRPLRGLEDIAEQEHRAEMQAYIQRDTANKIAAEIAKGKAKSAPVTMPEHERAQLTAEAARLASRKEEEPTPRRYIVNDSTPEKLAENIGRNPRGLLVMRDELMGLLESFEKHGHEGEKEFYLEAWSGLGTYRVDRVGRGDNLIKPLCANVFGGIQPQKLESYLWKMQAEGNNGFMQRFQLLVYPDDRPDIAYVDQEPDRAARDEVQVIAERLAFCDFEKLGAKHDTGADAPYFRFDKVGAQPIFVKWLMAHEKRVAAEDSPLMAEHLSKYRKLVPALALIFYLIDVASKPTPPPTKPTKSRAAPRRELRIGKGHVLLALRWAAVLETHARRIYLMGTDYRVAAAKSLAKKIEAGEVSDGFTARDVYRSGWTNLVDSELVKEACDELEDAHWLRGMENTPGGRGRPPKEARYEINPAVLAGQGVVPTKLTKGRGRTRS